MAEVFATGVQMGESPRWHDDRFWMCDWVAGETLRFVTHNAITTPRITASRRPRADGWISRRLAA
jgi:sugar lactone lactonase YvrE